MKGRIFHSFLQNEGGKITKKTNSRILLENFFLLGIRKKNLKKYYIEKITIFRTLDLLHSKGSQKKHEERVRKYSLSN